MASESFDHSATLVDFFATVMAKRATIVVVSMGIGLITGGLTFVLREVTYTAESQISPQTSAGAQTQIAGLAAQFGITVPTSTNAGETLDFYVEVLRSRELLTEVINTSYRVSAAPIGADTLGGDLIALFDISAPTAERRLELALKKLRRNALVVPSAKSGLINVRTTTQWPALSVAVNRRMLELVNQFNLSKRQSKARAERIFTEQRLAEARAELRAAQTVMEGWLDQNKSGTSGRLRFEERRLEANLNLLTQVVEGLAQSLERAKLDEVRDTPVLTVVDKPEGLVERQGRGSVLAALSGTVFGGLLATLLVLAAAQLRRLRSESPRDFERLDRALPEVIRRLVARIDA